MNWLKTLSRAIRALVAGDADVAEQLATEALQIETDSGGGDAATIYGPQLIGVNFERGTLDEFVPIIEQSAIANPGSSVSSQRWRPLRLRVATYIVPITSRKIYGH